MELKGQATKSTLRLNADRGAIVYSDASAFRNIKYTFGMFEVCALL